MEEIADLKIVNLLCILLHMWQMALKAPDGPLEVADCASRPQLQD